MLWELGIGNWELGIGNWAKRPFDYAQGTDNSQLTTEQK